MAALPLFPPVAICQPPPSLGVGAQGQGYGTGRRAVRGALPRSRPVALILRPAPFLRPSALCSPCAVLRVGYAAATPLFAGLLCMIRRAVLVSLTLTSSTPLESLWTLTSDTHTTPHVSCHARRAAHDVLTGRVPPSPLPSPRDYDNFGRGLRPRCPKNKKMLASPDDVLSVGVLPPRPR